MVRARTYTIHSGWRLLLFDLGLDPEHVLRLAELPLDLLGRSRATLTTEEFFRLWRGIEAASNDSDVSSCALRIAQVVSMEAFDPPIFAAFCSPNLNTALQRMARYKALIGPMRLHADVGTEVTSVELEWLEPVRPPMLLVLAELLFFVQLARLATRTHIDPVEVQAPDAPPTSAAFTAFLGAELEPGERVRLVFRAEDAARPFLTVNETMWEFFEPELRRRLSELEPSADTIERVRAALLELLPSGEASVAAVSRKLGTSTRTLQRRLKQEGRSYQSVLDGTREELASYYLKNTELPGAEISYLIGFEDPNCFFRAYRNWTGSTPSQARLSLRGDGPGG